MDFKRVSRSAVAAVLLSVAVMGVLASPAAACRSPTGHSSDLAVDQGFADLDHVAVAAVGYVHALQPGHAGPVVIIFTDRSLRGAAPNQFIYNGETIAMPGCGYRGSGVSRSSRVQELEVGDRVLVFASTNESTPFDVLRLGAPSADRLLAWLD